MAPWRNDIVAGSNYPSTSRRTLRCSMVSRCVVEFGHLVVYDGVVIACGCQRVAPKSTSTAERQAHS